MADKPDTLDLVKLKADILGNLVEDLQADGLSKQEALELIAFVERVKGQRIDYNAIARDIVQVQPLPQGTHVIYEWPQGEPSEEFISIQQVQVKRAAREFAEGLDTDDEPE